MSQTDRLGASDGRVVPHLFYDQSQSDRPPTPHCEAPMTEIYDQDADTAAAYDPRAEAYRRSAVVVGKFVPVAS